MPKSVSSKVLDGYLVCPPSCGHFDTDFHEICFSPTQVANTAATTAHEAWSLSTLQRSTLQWMLWRERSDEEKEGRGGAPGGGSASLAAAIDSFVSDNSSNSGAGTRVRGGVLGHLSAEEASSCVHALVKGGVASDDTRGTTSGR